MNLHENNDQWGWRLSAPGMPGVRTNPWPDRTNRQGQGEFPMSALCCNGAFVGMIGKPQASASNARCLLGRGFQVKRGLSRGAPGDPAHAQTLCARRGNGCAEIRQDSCALTRNLPQSGNCAHLAPFGECVLHRKSVHLRAPSNAPRRP